MLTHRRDVPQHPPPGVRVRPGDLLRCGAGAGADDRFQRQRLCDRTDLSGRYVNGVDLHTSTRPVNLTPLGINYSDCTSDMILSFNVYLSGFDGNENLQVWASQTSDCTAITDRGGTGAVAATCWPVAPQYWLTGPIISGQSVTIQVRVQDLVGPQNAPPFPSKYVAHGADACNAQPTFAAVPMTINFVPVASSIEQLDQDGNVIESEAGSSTSGSGGISTIPDANLIGVASGGVTVPDKSTGSYTISGLKDNSQYNVVVAAVDGFGNIGPPSAEGCNSPAPIEDFWKIYRNDGGMAGGGLCSLEEIGARGPSTAGLLLFGGCGALLVRRRIARRRSRRGGVDARRNIQ